MSREAAITEPQGQEIAVVGMAGRFPGAKDLGELWTHLAEGVESITFFSDDELRQAGVGEAMLARPDFVKAYGALEGVELFDASFFGYSPREAETIDPQQRLFLEACWQALEDAGYDSQRFAGKISVHAGASLSSYLLQLYPMRERLQQLGIDTTMLLIGNDKDSLATRVAHKMNLRGSALTVQTACSSSLVAVHLACQSLLSGESDLALAGGVTVSVPQKRGYLYTEEGIYSPDGHCRAFDVRAQGTVFGSGVGLVVLKRLEEAVAEGDSIYAVIKGSAVNNDGSAKVGYTAPSVDGQAEVIVEALATAGVDPDSIGYVEAHGTATALGDSIEIAALTKAFSTQTDRRGFCALGSVKTNLGHLEVTAGIAGLLKTVLAIHHGAIPPSLHFSEPHPNLGLPESPFYVNTKLAQWKDRPRRAGVSSFGFGGTNVHGILEEAPPPPPSSPGRPWQLLPLSARTPTALDAAGDRLRRALAAGPAPEIADAAFTLQLGRRELEHRRAVVTSDREDAVAALEDPGRWIEGSADGGGWRIAFLLPGQGAQHAGMARHLWRHEPGFRAAFERCGELFAAELGVDLEEAVYADADDSGERLEDTAIAQPALFAVEYALGRLWESWGVRPQALVGHSVGEVTAACLAGVLELPDAVRLVAARARGMAALPRGDMLAVLAPEEKVVGRVGEEISLSAVNGPALTVLSGTPEAVAAVRRRLEEEGIECRRLHTSHAFHSHLMEPMLGSFADVTSKVTLAPPRIPLVSTLTGTWMTAEEATDPTHWVRQARQTVRFGAALETLLAEERCFLLEVGPGQGLVAMARQVLAPQDGHRAVASLPHPRDDRSDLAHLLEAAGELWTVGVPLLWEGLHEGSRRRRVHLPTYPFERQAYLLDLRRLRELAQEVQTPAAPPSQSTAPPPPPLQQAPPPAATAPRPSTAATAADSYLSRRYAVRGEASAYVAPRDEVDETFAEIFQTLLGVERVGIEDNFFRLGGNSLVALQVISRIQQSFGVKLSVRSFFESPTIAELAALVRQRRQGEEAAAPEEVSEPAGEEPSPQPRRPLPAAPPAREPVAAVAAQGGGESDLRFSVFFFSGSEAMFPEDKYRLVVEAAKFADRHDFTAIWTPERHFHDFGGLYPNPAVLGAALAQATERLEIRAGSVVPSLHHPVRVAEEWSVVDNLSHGRVGLSFASGFHPSDFVFEPEGFATRREVMWDRVDLVRRLWRGDRIRQRDGAGAEVEVEIFPKPVRPELPVWITCGNTPATFERAGALGFNVLTALIGLSVDRLEERIRLYREARARHGHDPATGEVAVMIHTFIGEDLETVKEQVRDPFCGYLRSHTQLLRSLARSLQKIDDSQIRSEDLEELLMMEFERYFYTGSLMGTPSTCLEMLRRLAAIGVTEVGCLLDFGVDVEAVLESLRHLEDLRQLVSGEAVSA